MLAEWRNEGESDIVRRALFNTICAMLYHLLRVTVLTLLNVCAVAGHAAATPAATDVRLGIHADKTRLVLELSERVEVSHFALADPYRIVVDLPELVWRVDRIAHRLKGGLVDGLRFGLFKPGQSRLVLDLNAPATVADAFVLPPKEGYPHRLVLDLKPLSREAFMQGLRPPTPQVQPSAKPPPSAESTRKTAADPFIVVLDPGHGGVDPGAISPSGFYEKDLTLAFATAIRDALSRHPGMKVVMTRDSDVFLRLRERVAVARHADGDLFVSLHADSIANPRVRGGGIYTLSEKASDAEAEALAAKENRADVIAGVNLLSRDDEVASILIELTQRETMNYSARFANALIPELKQHIRLRRKPHRFAGFRVLKAPDVPSVLIELGYLSNREDEAMLRSENHRRAIARAIADAIVGYRQVLGR